MTKQELETAKQKMREYRDFFGGELNKSHLINEAKNRLDLDDIIAAHFDYIIDMASDAESHLERFRQNAGI